MRGRTNISGGGNGLAINGSIEQFQVAEGNTIVAGDFVEYEKLEQEEYFDSNHYGKVYPGFKNVVIPYKENIYVFLSAMENSVVHLAKLVRFEKGSLEIIYNFPDIYGEGNFYIMESGEFVVKSISGYIYIYRYENDVVTLISSIAVSNSNDSGTGICSLKNLILDISYNYCYIYRYGESEINYFGYKSFQSGGTSASSVHVRCFPVSDNIVMVFSFISSYVYLTTLEIIDDGEDITYTQNRSTLFNNASTGSPAGYYVQGNIQCVDKKVLVTRGGFNDEISFSDTYIYSWEDEFYKNNFQFNPFTIIKYEGFYDDFQYLVPYSNLTVQFVKNNVIMVACMPVSYSSKSYTYTRDKLVIFRIELDWENYLMKYSNMVQYDPTEEIESTANFGFGWGNFFEDNEGNIIYIYQRGNVEDNTGRYLLNLNYNNGILSLGEQTNLVKPYSGGSAMGIAKDSGTAGDTIDVYVPSITT